MGRSARALAGVILALGLATAPAARAVDVEDLRGRAERGDTQAALLLGSAYDAGLGVPRDGAEAAKWYEQAAQRGDPDAQYRLGILYREGNGVFKDAARAYLWFSLAAARPGFLDSDDAAEYRDRVARDLSPEQLAKARKAVDAWRPAGS